MRVETLFSRAGCEIVASPFLVGPELELLALEASEDWVRSLPAARLAEQPPPVALEILNGGHYYFAANAYERVTGRTCHVATVKAKRGHASAETFGGPAHLDRDLPAGTELWRSEGSDWCVRVWDADPVPAGPLLVGDTIATGTTLAGVLRWAVAKMEAAGAVHDIFVFSIAGAADFADGGVLKKLAPLDEILKRHGREVFVTFANGRFALQPNGTDLSPCPELGAELVPSARALLEAQVGAEFLNSMKCAIWDWGDRFRKPLEHLEEVSRHFAALPACPAYIAAGVEERLAALRAAAAAGAEEGPAKRPRTAEQA